MSAQQLTADAYQQAIDVIRRLRSENAYLRGEVIQLKQHIADLAHDLEAATKEEADDLTPAERLGER